MGISQFPAPDTGGGVTNDFILNKNNTTNNVFEPGRSFEAGGYSVVVTGSTAYDVYLLDSAGSSVGYTNGTSIVASGAFESISALGLGTADTVAFTYNGPSTNAGTAGTETGAGAYLTSITPSDLPQIDDTAIVAGGNFASDVQITFTSGTVELSAKNIVYSSSTALVVTRPDALIEDNAPYDLVAVNPGITVPSGSDANILAGTVTAGTDPAFVTTSPILGAFSGTAFSTAILTSDSEGTVVSWEVTAGTVPTGLTLGTADGSLAGTPTVAGDYFFTVQITDDGGNTNSAEFNVPVDLQLTGGNSTVVGGTSYVYFTASDDLVYKNASSDSVEYLVIAGGGAGGNATRSNTAGGGGGAGGLLFGTATLDGFGTATATIGAGGAGLDSPGVNTTFTGIATATGGGEGGAGGSSGDFGGNGGSGGGAGGWWDGPSGGIGTGIPGQGNNGGSSGSNPGGGGGGAGATGSNTSGGNGRDFGAWATATGLIFDGGYFAGGGSGAFNTTTTPGLGGAGGNGTAAQANSGSGGGGRGLFSPGTNGTNGGSGLVIVRVP